LKKLYYNSILTLTIHLHFPTQQKNKLKIEPHYYKYSLFSQKLFVWGDLPYKADVALYGDWNYFKNVSGGINSLSAGVEYFLFQAIGQEVYGLTI